jgi:hypothetical protein
MSRIEKKSKRNIMHRKEIKKTLEYGDGIQEILFAEMR